MRARQDKNKKPKTQDYDLNKTDKNNVPTRTEGDPTRPEDNRGQRTHRDSVNRMGTRPQKKNRRHKTFQNIAGRD